VYEADSRRPEEDIVNLDPLKKVLTAALLLGFIALYVYFIIAILTAKSGIPPTFSSAAVDIAAILSGALGTAFAVALGVKGKDENTRGLLVGGPSETLLLTIGIWIYAIVGIMTVVVYIIKPNETPGSISAMALLIAGYVAAVVANAYKAVIPKP
jgi:hypothetical protein